MQAYIEGEAVSLFDFFVIQTQYQLGFGTLHTKRNVTLLQYFMSF